MIVLTAGKGGVGKTTCTALLVDSLPDNAGRILVVDADPAQTLHLALGLPEPETTLAQVMDELDLSAGAIRSLPVSVEQHTANLLRARGVLQRHVIGRREREIVYMAMGRSHQAGCYCQVNNVLARVLQSLWPQFDLVLVDAEAGLEHLNRKRIGHADLLLLVATPDRAALQAAARICRVVNEVGIVTGQVGLLVNRTALDTPDLPVGVVKAVDFVASLPACGDDFAALEHAELPVTELAAGHPLRQIIEHVVVERILIPAKT